MCRSSRQLLLHTIAAPQAQPGEYTLALHAALKPPGDVRGLEQHAPQQAVAAVPRVKLVLLGDSVRLRL